MPEIGGVWYGDHAYEHMARLAEQLHADGLLVAQPDGRTAEINEAEVIHAFHEEFPGVTMREADDEEA